MLVKDHDPEEDIDHHQKKSVFAKVKERAKKLRYSLSNKKRHGEDENTTPSWGYNLDEDEDEDDDDIDAEYLGAPSKLLSMHMFQIPLLILTLTTSFPFSFAVYESELAPEDCKEHARQHPRADPVIAENHVLANTIKLASGQDEKPSNSSATSSQMDVGSSLDNSKTAIETTPATVTKKIQENEAAKPSSPSKTLAETVTEKLAPVYSSVTDATHAIASKIHSLTVSTPSKRSARSLPATPKKPYSPTTQKTSSSPTTSQAPKHGKGTEQIWDKGVSVKEYLLHKFEPGEDERALSRVLSDAMSPRKKPGDVSVVEKMREAVNSMLRGEKTKQPNATKLAAKSSSHVEVTPKPVAAHLPSKSSSLADKTPEPVVAKSSLRAESTPQPMTAHLATKPSSRAEKAPQPMDEHMAAKSLSRVEEAPQAILAVHLAAKPSSHAKEAPQQILATHLAAKASLPEATPQPMVAHLSAKSSLNAPPPIFTTTHRGELLLTTPSYLYFYSLWHACAYSI